ncbi:alkanesulfonate monooxygenase SsuD/methylene tetrahydromethanopterin reductase-like flavin-dependent oxidoreductase (luciferase family) [Rhodoligotrophos appendicifer]|uniref:LLM class flavin-dependent oxidoreductase n=1 Tax=Rhodoligotrophos appendicifer TaxID=987056 RepID=UPI00117BF308|nr:LLM class flavin-dependent oxidoreductase [Rhodoligotrophos appendicifer]
MKFGLFNLVQRRDPGLPPELTLKQLVDEVTLSEEVGMDVAWVAEHHFSNYGLSASPLMTLLWLAGKTKRIRLAPGVLVLPFYHPMRLVQEFGLANLFTNDRIDFGFGVGYQHFEFERFGVTLADAGDRTVEFMEIVHQAIERGEVDFQGKFYDIAPTGMVSPPKAMPTVYLAAALNHPRLPRLVVQRGYVPMVSPAWNPFELVLKHRRFYDNLASEEGVDPASTPFALMRFVHVTNSKEDGRKAAEALRYSTRIATATRFNYAEFDNSFAQEVPAENEPSLEQIVANAVIGDVATCIDKMTAEIQATRATHYAFMMNVGGLDPAAVKRSIQVLGEDVLPEVKKNLGLGGGTVTALGRPGGSRLAN